MATSEAQRRARDKWNRKHLTVLSCNVTTEKKELFKKACKLAGTTQNAVLLAAVNKFLEEHPVEKDSPEN